MGKVRVVNNCLEVNDEYLSLDFDYLAVAPSRMRHGDYSLVYQRETETIELMLGAKKEEDAKTVLKDLQQQFAKLEGKAAQYSQTTDEVIVNYKNVVCLEKIRMPFRMPQTAVRFKNGHIGIVTTLPVEINKIRKEFENYNRIQQAQSQASPETGAQME